MQINVVLNTPVAANIVGPVPTLPAPGEVYVCGQEVTAHIAVTNLAYCTAVFFYDPVSRARAMIHYNPVSGPFEGDFRWCVRHLQERYGAQPGGLTVALFNNTHSSGGVPFYPGIYRTDRIKGWLETALGPAHNNMTVNRYMFRGSVGLMDAGGNVWACPGPDIEDKVRARKMNWNIARHGNQPRQGLIGNR